MQIPFILFTALLVLSCSDRNKPQVKATSYWESLKDSFATKNLDSFVVDADLEHSYKNFHRIQNKINAFGEHETHYLYSWQEHGSGLTAFTTFVDEGEHGSRIMYFVFDGNDSLRSATQVAGKGGEGGILYETRSRFTAKDTLLTIRAATMAWDPTQPGPPKGKWPKGDSTFLHLIFLKDGKVAEKKFAEKNELNLE